MRHMTEQNFDHMLDNVSFNGGTVMNVTEHEYIGPEPNCYVTQVWYVTNESKNVIECYVIEPENWDSEE